MSFLQIFLNLLKNIFGSKYKKDLAAINPYVKGIESEYSRLRSLSNDYLRSETDSLRVEIKKELAPYKEELDSLLLQLSQNKSADKNTIEELNVKIEQKKKDLKKKKEEVLLSILPSAFAIVKDTARRFTENEEVSVTATPFDLELSLKRDYIHIENETKAVWKTSWDVMGITKRWDMVHFDEQLIGGVVLHQGKIAEMATGEGKTLVSTLPIFLNALTGDGVHVVTVNDYLSKRDYMWNRPLFEFHGLTVGCIEETRSGSEARKKAYDADITYGTNNEFGFDYLRDNMALNENEIVQRGHSYAIIDEVDSVLIDDARTPLIISGAVDADKNNTSNYLTFQPFVKALVGEQSKIVNECLLKVKDNFSKDIRDEATGLLLFRAHRGLPKYKPLIKFLSEAGNKQFLNKNEAIYLENNCERMSEVDEGLLFSIEEKNRNVELTDKGIEFISKKCGEDNFFLLPDIVGEMKKIDENSNFDDLEKDIRKRKLFEEYSVKTKRIHVVQQLLKAYTLFEKEVDYVVLGGHVLIVDEQTGRILDGRRYSDGIHQAIEAKEMVKVEAPSQTYATITLQNYFRMYDKLAGMTGTAITEAAEFLDIYKLDVVTIPTHKMMIRSDLGDVVYKTAKVKFNAIVDKIVELSTAGRPVLVGTASVETSEVLSRMLTLRKIKHQVLNAKYHEKEAEIISHAGEGGTVTIATNMAGRGTDIKLDEKARAAGGLAILGSEKHDSRRIDRQLRGRAGRQGDPGSSQFFVSFEDNLMRMTLGENKVQMFIDGLGEDDILDGVLVTRAIEKAQRNIEENNFGYRRRILEYDDVLNTQRNKIYGLRNKALKNSIGLSDVYEMFMQLVEFYFVPEKEDIRYEDISLRYHKLTGDNFFEKKTEFEEDLYKDIADKLYKDLVRRYDEKSIAIAKSVLVNEQTNEIYSRISDGEMIVDVNVKFNNNVPQTDLEKGRYILTQLIAQMIIIFIDKYWKKHLKSMTELKRAVQTAYYEQRDPLLIYKIEAYDIFTTLITELNSKVMSFVFKCYVVEEDFVKDEAENMQILQAEILEQMRKKLTTLIN